MFGEVKLCLLKLYVHVGVHYRALTWVCALRRGGVAPNLHCCCLTDTDVNRFVDQIYGIYQRLVSVHAGVMLLVGSTPDIM